MTVLSDQKREVVSVNLTDLSDYPNSYNLFEIGDIGLGAMYGDYEYKVTGFDAVVAEVGKLRYHAPTVMPEAFASPNADNIVYAPS